MKTEKAKVGDRVTVTDGSSDGHTGTVIAVKSKSCVRIKRDADGIEVDVSNFYIHKGTSNVGAS